MGSLADSRDSFTDYGRDGFRAFESGHRGKIHPRRISSVQPGDGLDLRSVCVRLCTLSSTVGVGRGSFWPAKDSDAGDPVVGNSHHGNEPSPLLRVATIVESRLDLRRGEI